MKRVGLAGLCVAAVLALSMMATAVASAEGAEGPEYGRCIKLEKAEGEGFSDAGCTKIVATGAKYEWIPGPGPEPGFTTKLTTTTATLETATGAKVVCTGESSAGEITGTMTLSLGGLKFTGCSMASSACSSAGAASGEIITAALIGNLRVQMFGSEPRLDKLADELVPASGSLYAEFECGGVKVEVRKEATGGILDTILADKMLSSSTEKYAGARGEQKPSEYEASKGTKVLAGLESSLSGGFSETGLTMSVARADKEKNEANAVAVPALPRVVNKNKVRLTIETLTGATGPMLLETAGTKGAQCTEGVISGRLNDRVGKAITLKLEGCKELKTNAACQTAPAEPGVIKTNALTGFMRFVEGEKPRTGLRLLSINAAFAEFTCGANSYVVDGQVIGTVTPLDVLRPPGRMELSYKQALGVQEVTKLENEAAVSLEVEINKKVPAEKTGLSGKPEFVFENAGAVLEPAEIKTK